MTAEIVSIGTELLMGQIADTDAQHLGTILPEYGVAHYHRQTVGDNFGRLVDALRLALNRAEIVFTIGGLGPTEDDLTREAIAAALDDELETDPVYAEKLRRLFAQRNLPWLETQLKQAQKPTCATFIDNPNGSAPGLLCRKNGKVVIAMPGPRGEFIPMAEGPIRAFLGEVAGGRVIASRTLKVCGMGESMVEERVRDLIQGSNPSVGVYAHPGEVHLRVSAGAPTREEADALIAPVEAEMRTRLGTALFGADKDTLASVLLDRLRRAGQSLAVAESCTGGLVGGALTAVSGSSDVFAGGMICYANTVKVRLGVPESTLAQHGAVSKETAEAMAAAARDHFAVDWALSVTGIAGPGGGTDAKPVGLVYVGCAGPNGIIVEEHRFRGTREFIRQRSVQASLTLAWNQALR